MAGARVADEEGGLHVGIRRLLVERTGGESAEPIVLIHGVGGRLENWDSVVTAFGPGLRVVRYDLRGHGPRAVAGSPISLDCFVDDHLHALASAGLERSHLVGESLGGLIAQAIAIRAPHVVQRLVLLSCVAGRTREERARVLARLGRVELEGPAQIAAMSVERWFTPEFCELHPGAVEAMVERVGANDPLSYAAAYRVLAESDLVDDVHRIEAATLVMTGEHDVGSPPRMAAILQQRIPCAELVVFPGQRHMPILEIPALLAGRIEEFVGRVTPPGGTE